MQQFGEFFIHHWELFLALAVTVGLLIHNLFGGRLHGYKEVDPAGAVHLMNREEATVVDVREDKEFKEGHIGGAHHIPLASLASRVGELEQYRDKPLILGCRSGNRSARACGILAKEGFENLYNLRGGIMAWQSANLPVAKPRKAKGKKKRKD